MSPLITDIKIEEYQKDFLETINLGNKKFDIRNGWYITIYSDQLYGKGEASPIPYISLESHEQAGYALNGFKLAVKGIDYKIELEELLLLSEVHGFEIPSAQFAIESAIYDLFSKFNNKSIAHYLNPNTLKQINLNSLYHKNSTIDINSSEVLKIKINETNIFTIKEKIDDIVKKYPHNPKLRIDFNEGLDLPRAIRICSELKSYNIDYIEQPLSKSNIYDFYDLRMTTDIPIAVDESLTDYKSVCKIINEGAADVLIIKPTLTGSFNEIKKIFTLSQEEGLRTILTSSFETSIAQFHILNIIAALEISEYCGVFNVRLFKDDFSPIIHKNQCKIAPQNHERLS